MNTSVSQLDSGASASSKRNSSQTTVTSSTFHNFRTKPTCARCRLHGKFIPVKGHKRSCEFRNCDCGKCYVVAKGGWYRAIHLAMTRAAEKERKAGECKKDKSRETDRNTSSETERDNSRETGTPSVQKIDSLTVIDSAVLPSSYGCCNVQNLSTNTTAMETCNMIPPPQPEHQLPHSLAIGERTHTLSLPGSNSSETQSVVPRDWKNKCCSTIPPQELKYGPLKSGNIQPTELTWLMAKPRDTIPGPQPNLQLPIPSRESFTGTGPLTTAIPFVTGICSPKDRRNMLSSCSTGGSTLPIDPNNSINNARSTIQQQQPYIQLSYSSSHNFPTYAPQIQAVPNRTGLQSTTDGSDLYLSDSTSNTAVPNLSSFWMNNASYTKYSNLCGHLNIVQTPGTDFHSVDSLSLSFPSNRARTPPTSSASVNDARSIQQWQPVMRPSQCLCGSISCYGTSGTSYDTLIWQYDLNSRYLNDNEKKQYPGTLTSRNPLGYKGPVTGPLHLNLCST